MPPKKEVKLKTNARVDQIRLMREMWDAKVWEGYEVTLDRLVEWFGTERYYAKLIVERKIWKDV